MHNRLIEKLVCPVCKGELEYDDKLLCIRCDQSFDFIEGIPNFLPEKLFKKYNLELKDQDLIEEQNFYDNLYSDLKDLDDGHCVVYGYEELYDFMSDIPSGTLLDVGCGAGHHSKDLAIKGFEVTGIDISVNGLFQAKKVCKSSNQIVDFILGDIENLPFADNSYDVVFCGLILHHFPKKNKILYELTRVCKSCLVALEVNSYDLISFFRFNILNPTIGIHNITRNQRTVSPVKLESDLRLLGFSNFEFNYIDVHHNIGRYPNNLKSKMLYGYKVLTKFLPYRFRFNKFMMKCKKIY